MRVRLTTKIAILSMQNAAHILVPFREPTFTCCSGRRARSSSMSASSPNRFGATRSVAATQPTCWTAAEKARSHPRRGPGATWNHSEHTSCSLSALELSSHRGMDRLRRSSAGPRHSEAGEYQPNKSAVGTTVGLL